MKFTKAIGLSLLLPVLAATTVLAAETGSFDRTLQVSGPVTIEVRTGSGSIRVHTGNDTSVHVSATIRARDSWFGMSAQEKVRKLQSNPPIEQTGNTITIGRIEDRDLRSEVSIDYDLTVPAQTRLTSRSGSGTQTINGVKLPVNASTGSGGVTVENAGDQVHVSAGSGTLTINSAKGPVEASTGSGSIRATGIGGDMRARAGSGTIDIEQTAPGNIDVSTGSGTVKVHGVKGGLKVRTGSGSITAEGDARRDWTLSAGSGGIELVLPAQASFNLDAETRGGTVTVNRQLSIQGTIAKNRVQGKAGNGGVQIDLHTGSGNIRVN